MLATIVLIYTRGMLENRKKSRRVDSLVFILSDSHTAAVAAATWRRRRSSFVTACCHSFGYFSLLTYSSLIFFLDVAKRILSFLR